MTKVLMVCTVPTGKSGIPIVAFNLIEAMHKNRSSNLKIGYVSINQLGNDFRDNLLSKSIDSYVIPRKISNPLGYILKLSKVAKDYDVMHVHGNSATMVLEMAAARIAGVKLRIAHSHNTACKSKTIDKLARPLFYSLCNSRLACGVEAGEWLFSNKNFKVVNNGIDIPKFKFNSETRELIRKKINSNDSILFGHIGNFNYQKNHEFLIEIFNEIKKLKPNSKLLLLGSGELRNTIQKKAELLSISDSVIFEGSVSNPQEWMNAMDMVIMPSRFEGLPLTMIEEQANGLPILAADTITADANITNKVYYKSLNISPVEWAKAAIEISSIQKHNELESERCIQLIKRAGYDINDVAANLISYYNQFLSKHK